MFFQDTTYVKDQDLKLSIDPKMHDQCDQNTLYIDYKGLVNSVKKGTKILVADGMLSLQVTDVQKDHVMVKVLNTTAIGSRKNCNLPGCIVDLPAVSEKDILDLKFGVEQKVSNMSLNGTEFETRQKYRNHSETNTWIT